jgi:hypothetical protein
MIGAIIMEAFNMSPRIMQCVARALFVVKSNIHPPSNSATRRWSDGKTGIGRRSLVVPVILTYIKA